MPHYHWKLLDHTIYNEPWSNKEIIVLLIQINLNIILYTKNRLLSNFLGKSPPQEKKLKRKRYNLYNGHSLLLLSPCS